MKQFDERQIEFDDMEIIDWLETEDQPRDLYHLLCAKRFDPDTAGLRQAISKVSRDLLPYQGHANPEVAKSAMRLLTELGGADMILGNDEKLRDHNCHVAEMLLDDFLDHKQIEIDDVKRKEFASWLVSNAGVHPDAVKTVIQDWLQESLPKPAPKTAPRATAQKKSPAPQRKPRKRRKRQDLEDLFDDLGVSQPRRKRPSSRGSSGRSQSSRGGRGRKKKQQAFPIWIPLTAGGVILLLIILVVALSGGDESGKVTVIVDPADSVVTTDFEGARVESNGETHQIIVEDARLAEDGIQVSVEKEGFITGGFRWVPQPGQETVEPVEIKLIVDFEARKKSN